MSERQESGRWLQMSNLSKEPRRMDPKDCEGVKITRTRKRARLVVVGDLDRARTSVQRDVWVHALRRTTTVVPVGEPNQPRTS